MHEFAGLHAPKLRVEPAALHEFVAGSRLGDLPRLHHPGAVGDDAAGVVLGDAGEGALTGNLHPPSGVKVFIPVTSRKNLTKNASFVMLNDVWSTQSTFSLLSARV